jgi:Calcineurin-like phosphoesterase
MTPADEPLPLAPREPAGDLLVTPIWDLRRGDHDDDRMSPYGGGMRSVVLSAAFEFNFLKALIVFLTLIVGPALLLGLALSLAVTYGRLVLHAMEMAERSPAVGLALLGLLIGFALWAGRPLLRVGFDNFRQLHYTLVFPIFVALRELLRTIAERLHGRSITPQQLNRGRRIGAVAAALVFAAAGGALAWATWSSGFKVLDAGHIQPWALVKAALINAAMVVGVSTAIDSLYWLRQELMLSGPVLDWTPRPASRELPMVRIAHVSDLHLVGERYGYRMEAGTRGPRGNGCVTQALRKLVELQKESPLDRVLVTGDITDAGTRAEWAEFIDLLRDFPGLRERLSFVPGNHDVNVVDRTNAGRLDLPWSSSQSLRKLRTILALDQVQGGRARVVDRASGSLGPSLRDYLREGGRANLLRSLAERGSVRGRWELEKVWDAIFPLVEPPEGNRRYGVILLDSNARTHFSLTNAIGFVSPPQLRALKSILKNCPLCPWIIVLHHQVVEYPVALISLVDRIGLALVNASDVLAGIGPYASNLIVLHGHRHRDWIGTSGNVVLCSAPSAALGSQSGMEDRGFCVHNFSCGADGSIRLMRTERIHVA